jgi:hypothetical protein
MKIIGTKKERTPEECFLAQEKLIEEVKKTSTIRKKKGIVLKFKTWKELEEFELKRYTEYYE